MINKIQLIKRMIIKNNHKVKIKRKKLTKSKLVSNLILKNFHLMETNRPKKSQKYNFKLMHNKRRIIQQNVSKV